MFEVDALTVRYGAVTALDDVSFTAPQGQITAVLGANGAGKTTLLRTVSGLVRPGSGRIRLAGRDITRIPAERLAGLGVAHVPEGRGVIAQLTVAENLRLGSLHRAAGTPVMEPAEVFSLFPPLAARRNAHAHTLSGGERQMLVIGRALMARPRVLLLDEPSLGLAPRVVAQILALIRSQVEQEGLTVVLVEQNARSALSVADLGVVLNLGRVVAREPASALSGDDQLRHAYLGF